MDVAVLLVALGILTVLIRRNLLGVLIGIQLMFMGVSLLFVTVGIISGKAPQGQVAALVSLLSSIGITSVGVTIYSRIFLLNGNIHASSIEKLKH